MTNKERSKEVAHWQSVIRKYNTLSYNRPLTTEESQQRHLAQHKINELYEIPLCRYPNCGCNNSQDCISYLAKTENI